MDSVNDTLNRINRIAEFAEDFKNLGNLHYQRGQLTIRITELEKKVFNNPLYAELIAEKGAENE